MTLTCNTCHFPVETEGCESGCHHRLHCDCDGDDGGRDVVVVGEVDGLDVTRHAVQRWLSRTESSSPPRIEDAWRAAVPVGCDDIDGKARLYPPENMLLVSHTGKLRTAIGRGSHHDLRTAHLVECKDCELLWYPADSDGCPWCPDEGDSRQTVSVTGKPTGGAANNG